VQNPIALLDKGAISQWHIDLLMSWHHSGFNVHICEPIAADDRQALEKLSYNILAFIEEDVVIRKILDHLGLCDVPKRQPKQGRGFLIPDFDTIIE